MNFTPTKPHKRDSKGSKTLWFFCFLSLFFLSLSVLAVPPLPANAARPLPPAPVPKQAAEVRQTDFARAYELKTTLDGAIYKFALPRVVYEGLMQSQRRDLAVFNADGQTVPFSVREAAPVYQISELPGQPVPFYELPSGSRDENAAGPLDVYVQTGAGQTVSVRGGGEEREKRFRRYILDFSSIALDDAAVKHELRLSLPDLEFSAKLSVFESANRRDWLPLLTDVPLMRLKNRDSQLVSDRVELPRPPGHYILLQIENAAPAFEAFELKGVEYFAAAQSVSVREEEADIRGTLTEAQVNARSVFAVEYDALGAFPINRIHFILQEPGFYRAEYFSRSDVKNEWRTHGATELSMIRNQDGSVRSNPPEPVKGNTGVCEDRYWRLVFEGAFSGTPPVMKINWQPGEVFFLAQGKAPYVLAFGSPLALPPLQNSAFLQDGGASAMESELGAAVSMDSTPENPSLAADGENVEWQRYLVWGLLVSGGLLLSGMAWKLGTKK